MESEQGSASRLEQALPPQPAKLSVFIKRHFSHILAKEQAWYTLIQALCGLGSVLYLIHLPPPGYAVAVVAGVAAAMSVHGQMKSWQKVVWMALIGVLLVIETRAISADRAASNEAARVAREKQDDKFAEVLKAQKEQFSCIANGLARAINSSNEQFRVTLKNGEKLFGKAEETVSTLTGGNGFCFIDLFTLGMVAIHKGRFSLYDVNIRIANVRYYTSPGIDMSNDVVWKIPELGSNQALPNPVIKLPYHPMDGDKAQFNVFFIARNGSWSESFTVIRKNGLIVDRAIRVLANGTTDKNPSFQMVTDGFPRLANGKVDW